MDGWAESPNIVHDSVSIKEFCRVANLLFRLWERDLRVSDKLLIFMKVIKYKQG